MIHNATSSSFISGAFACSVTFLSWGTKIPKLAFAEMLRTQISCGSKTTCITWYCGSVQSWTRDHVPASFLACFLLLAYPVPYATPSIITVALYGVCEFSTSNNAYVMAVWHSPILVSSFSRHCTWTKRAHCRCTWVELTELIVDILGLNLPSSL